MHFLGIPINILAFNYCSGSLILLLFLKLMHYVAFVTITFLREQSTVTFSQYFMQTKVLTGILRGTITNINFLQ